MFFLLVSFSFHSYPEMAGSNLLGKEQ